MCLDSVQPLYPLEAEDLEALQSLDSDQRKNQTLKALVLREFERELLSRGVRKSKQEIEKMFEAFNRDPAEEEREEEERKKQEEEERKRKEEELKKENEEKQKAEQQAN